jgi:putative transposase
MIYDPQKHHRRSIRLRGYDYSQAGAYFVTICARNHESIFGQIMEGKMVLNEYGQAVAECWCWLEIQYEYVELDECVVMPNHTHGIVILSGMDHSRRGGSRTAPTKPLGRLVGAFKTVSTKRINQMRHTPGAHARQRNYHEHVIRNEDELTHLRWYILDNPVQWNMDENNPNFQGEPLCQLK